MSTVVIVILTIAATVFVVALLIGASKIRGI